MKARISKHFPLVGGNVADECPVCHSQIVAIGFNRGICPSCAREEIIRLRKEVARLTKRAPDLWESAPLPSLSTPEADSTDEHLSTPPTSG